MRSVWIVVASLVAMLAIAACSAFPPTSSLAPGVSIDCGPIVDRDACASAAGVAVTAKINPPPISAIRIRRPAPGDDCLTQFHPCDSNDVIVSIQSGDTLQDVALKRTTNGWIRLDLIR
jgi:hypothetical protein